jgi:hypothetical protein
MVCTRGWKMKHIHAELMLQYAQDAMETDKPWDNWEFQENPGGDWQSVGYNPGWVSTVNYRRKPKMLSINGFEFPEPCRVAPAEGTRYYAPWYTRPWKVQETVWAGGLSDMYYLEIGFVHLTEEAATRHADAILSATK